MQKLEYLCNNHQQRENKIQSLQEIEQTDSVPILTIDFMNRVPHRPLEARTNWSELCHFKLKYCCPELTAAKWSRDKFTNTDQPISQPQAWDTSPPTATVRRILCVPDTSDCHVYHCCIALPALQQLFILNPIDTTDYFVHAWLKCIYIFLVKIH